MSSADMRKLARREGDGCVADCTRRGQIHSSVGGHSYRANIPDKFNCTICFELLSNPHQCKGGHLFCYNCICDWLTHNETCPSCRTPLTKTDLSRSIFVVDFINEIEVACNHSSQNDSLGGGSEGCAWVGQLSQFEEHCRNQCVYVPISCTNTGCSAMIPRKDLEKHLCVCPCEQIKCDLCFEKVRRCDFADHKDNSCSVARIECPNGCGKTFLRLQKAGHLKACTEAILQCPFSSYGCGAKDIRRKDFDEHIESSVHEHLSLALKHIEFLEKRNAELEARPGK